LTCFESSSKYRISSAEKSNHVKRDRPFNETDIKTSKIGIINEKRKNEKRKNLVQGDISTGRCLIANCLLLIYNKIVNNGELLRLEGIVKSFGAVEVLRGLDLSVGRGEFITLLGPSGCGKTTILRIIAGLETADAGRVFMDGVDVTALEPDKRGVNMVFQNYALFPHMNVEQNVGYSLKLRGLPKAEIKQAAVQALALMRLEGFEKRKPHELSGGQRQRVAVARAIINKPKALLLDEPLGALDLQLRRQLQVELKRIQQQLGISFIYITHDQEEALAMSDRVAVIRNGLFEQIGAAADVYKYPKTAFVAKFVGNANLIPHGEQYLAVREESIMLSPAGKDGQGIPAAVTGRTFAGGLLRISARLKDVERYGGAEICASVQGIESPFKTGDEVLVRWLPANVVTVARE
jgi:spermidine/putrescine transport system ATP-binding protein